MKAHVCWTLPLLLAACGGDDASTPQKPVTGSGGHAGQLAAGGAGQDSPTAAGGDGAGVVAPSGQLGTAHQLVPGPASMVGVTSDGWVLYRDSDSLRAAKPDKDGSKLVSDQAGNTLVRGEVVFNWANVDWTKNIGDLSIWTEAGGTQEVGSTTYSETLVAASDSGNFLVYTANTKSTKTDLMLASSDFSTNDALIAGMGIGSDTTCSPAVSFVGERLFVGWCKPGSREATIQRFENDGKSFVPTLIADNALASWSTDTSGDRVFYQNDNYEGFFSDDGTDSRIDAGVSRGFLLPDGSAVLYTVGDQLRRSSVPDANPVPVVTTGFSEPVAFTSSYGMVLYSTKVTYDNGTQRDLRLVATDGFASDPMELVADPAAGLARSSMTEDGQFVLYLTDQTPTGGTLHVVGMDGVEVLAIPGVLDALAAEGSGIVFSDNASDPDVYPNVADLKYVDPASGADPLLIEAKVTDAKNFQIDAPAGKVVYVRSGVDRDAADPEHDGLFWCDLP